MDQNDTAPGEMEQVWIVKPNPNREANESGWDPWDPWFDKAFGFVISARSEEEARQIAQENAADETRKSSVHHGEAERDIPVWTEPEWSICVPIEEYAEQSEDAVLMRDIENA